MARKKNTQTEIVGEVITGRVETLKPTTLDQILGICETSQYKTTDLESYENSLAEMNLADLQTHAHRIGLIATRMERGRLVQSLVREFKKVVAAATPAPVGEKRQIKLSKEAARILAEGA